MDRRVDVVGAVENLIEMQFRRKIFALPLEQFANAGNRLHCVCVRRQHDAEADRRISVVLRNDVVCLLTGFDASHVAELDERAVAVRFQDDVAELFNRDETPLNFAGELLFLPLIDGHRADGSGGSLQILLVDRADHFGDRQLQFGELVGIQPYSHRIIRAENLHVTDAADALELVENVNIGVIFHECAIVSTVRRVQRDHVRHVIRRFFCRDAGRLNIGRQRRIRNRDVVLHFDRVHIAVGADFKRHSQTVSTGVVGVRGHVIHALRAVDLLLDDLRDGFVDDLRVRAGVSCRHADRRRRNLRILRNRQLQARQYSHYDDDDRDDDCEDRTVNEKLRHTTVPLTYSLDRPASSARACRSASSSTIDRRRRWLSLHSS